MVLLSHMAPLSGRIEWIWMGEHSFGNFGVLIFFSISGYLVAASWNSDPDLWGDSCNGATCECFPAWRSHWRSSI